MTQIFRKFLPVFLLIAGIAKAAAADVEVIMGAGPSTPVVKLFTEYLQGLPEGRHLAFEVDQRSIKHAGGIRSSDKHLFGRTGRPLNDEEKALGKKEIFLARIPVGVVAGAKTGVRRITLQQLDAMYSGKVTNWREVGGIDQRIVLVGREQTEAVFTELKKNYAFFRHATFEHTLERDHQVINLMRSDKGDYALAFGALSNFDTSQHLHVEGFHPTVALGLVYDQKNADHPVIKLAIREAKSQAWAKLVVQNGMLAPE